ncbi:hypothetical protein Atai01_31450 [Amycolatopsis taiwanensis]|uniref:Uncharacterized protein n=1 Tax=Amycolatopsis taiwanensis TaxID=342230 RepID=A0A9W6R0S5_9PSEU|nr:hypothetical protein Atai01_31450 [Amycolatopsis taiwanensis]
MTSRPHTTRIRPSVSKTGKPPWHALRLRLKPKAPTTGYVDGAWWPRSRDLSTELPSLLAVLAIRPGRIERVSYNLTGWHPAGRRLPIEGGVVRLEGFRAQRPDTVTITGQGRQRLTLLVIPPEAAPAAAHRMLMTASQRGNLENIEDLLAAGRPAAPEATDVVDVEAQRWELDGGSV